MRVFQDTEAQGARLAEKYEIEGFPTLIIFNSSGRMVAQISGFRSAPDLIKYLKAIFHEADKPDGRISL